MVGRNRGGPLGKGRMTGRGFGYCTENTRGDEADASLPGRFGGFGHRLFRGANWGNARRRNLYPGYGKFTQGPVFELADGASQALANEIEELRGQLKALEDRLEELMQK